MPLALWDLIGLIVSRDNSCRYCYGATRTILRILGYREDADRPHRARHHLVGSEPLPERRGARIRPQGLARESARDGGGPRTRSSAPATRPAAVAEIVFAAAFAGFPNRVATLFALPPEAFETLRDRSLGRLLRPADLRGSMRGSAASRRRLCRSRTRARAPRSSRRSTVRRRRTRVRARRRRVRVAGPAASHEAAHARGHRTRARLRHVRSARRAHALAARGPRPARRRRRCSPTSARRQLDRATRCSSRSRARRCATRRAPSSAARASSRASCPSAEVLEAVGRAGARERRRACEHPARRLLIAAIVSAVLLAAVGGARLAAPRPRTPARAPPRARIARARDRSSRRSRASRPSEVVEDDHRAGHLHALGEEGDHRPVRRPEGLHAARRGARAGGAGDAAERLVRGHERGHRGAPRARGEVHRRRAARALRRARAEPVADERRRPRRARRCARALADYNAGLAARGPARARGRHRHPPRPGGGRRRSAMRSSWSTASSAAP